MNCAAREPKDRLDQAPLAHCTARTALEYSPDVIVCYDLELRRRYANRTFERLHDLTPEQYLGRRPTELSRIGDHALEVERLLRAALETGQLQELDFEWRAVDGRMLWHSVRIVVEHDEHGRPAGLLSIASDITARKQAERALVAREQEYRSLADAAGAHIMRWDLEGHIRYANPMAQRMLGTEPIASDVHEVAISTTVRRFDFLDRAVLEVVCGGEETTVEHRVRGRDGRDREQQVRLTPERDADGRVVGIVGVGHDITERKRVEAAWQFITQRGWGDDGESFFPALARFLARTLQIDYVLIDAIDDDAPGVAESVAMWSMGEMAPNVRYSLKGTPCETIARGTICAYGADVQQLFPLDQLLVEMQVQCYVGVPLLDPAGRAIGLIAVMDRNPLPDENLATAVLRLVAARACAELMRDRSDRLLQAREREYRSLAENSPDFIIRYDLQACAVYANPAVLARLGMTLDDLLGKTPGQTALPGNELAMAEYELALREVLHSGRPIDIELVLPGLDAWPETHDVRMVAVKAPNGRVDGVLSIARDVTQRRQAEIVLRRHEQEFRTLVENSPDLIERYDQQGRRVYANPALRDLLRDSVSVSDKSVLDGVVMAEADRYLRMVHTVLATGRAKQAELRYRRADESVGWVDARLCPETNDDGKVVSVFVVARDITQSVEQRERITALALSDPLTRLHNRQALYDYAPGLISEAQRHGRRLGVMILDIDRFKDVNDTFGHPAGDRLLCEVAQRIAECTRGYDLLVRLGGDEFAIVATNLEVDLDMATIAEKVDRALSAPLTIGGRQVVVSASIGIALYPADGEQLEELLAHADAAMYHAKRGGRRHYAFYQAEFSERARDRLALEHALRDAQHGEGLELHYQPLVDLNDGRIVGGEALLRWRHPELGLLSPDRFIGLAEETGLIIPIGRWVVEQVAQMARRWNEGRAEHLRLSFNASTRQFLKDDMAMVVRQALRQTGCQPQWLIIEVTESLLLEDSERVRETFRELSAAGLQIAIDDFGTGYSALNYLSKFDVQCLKIDRQFVRDIDTDPRQAELVKAFLSIARALRLGVVAEGIETSAQAAFLHASGCSLGQGFLFHRPMTSAAFAQTLQGGVRPHVGAADV